MKILVVDDERDIREYIRRLLELCSYEVVEADSGEAGLFALAKMPEIDLVILDWMMPGMSGIDVLAQLRDNNKHIPVLMLSAKHSQKDILKALEFGAIDYVLKPLEKDHFLFKVNGLINKDRKSARQHAARRKSVNFPASSKLIISGFSSRGIVLESTYPIEAGATFVLRSAALAKMLDIKPDSRYACRSLSCTKAEDKKYEITADLISLTPEMNQKLSDAAEKIFAAQNA